MATDTLKRLAGPVSLAGAAATVYTVPALTTTSLRSLHVTNETGASATFTMSIGVDGAGKRWFYNVPVANGDPGLDWSGVQVLTAGEVLQAYSGTASALTLTISGVETA